MIRDEVLPLKNYLGYYCYLMTSCLVKTHSLKLRKSTTALSTGSFLVLLLLFIPANILEFNNAWATPIEIPVYMLTTRDDREQAEGVGAELGYNTNLLADDGTMNIVVEQWQSDG